MKSNKNGPSCNGQIGRILWVCAVTLSAPYSPPLLWIFLCRFHLLTPVYSCTSLSPSHPMQINACCLSLIPLTVSLSSTPFSSQHSCSLSVSRFLSLGFFHCLLFSLQILYFSVTFSLFSPSLLSCRDWQLLYREALRKHSDCYADHNL